MIFFRNRITGVLTPLKSRPFYQPIIGLNAVRTLRQALKHIDSTYMRLTANLLLMVMRKGLSRSWSFSGMTTMILMYYVDFYSLFKHPEKDWESMLEATSETPNMPTLFD